MPGILPDRHGIRKNRQGFGISSKILRRGMMAGNGTVLGGGNGVPVYWISLMGQVMASWEVQTTFSRALHRQPEQIRRSVIPGFLEPPLNVPRTEQACCRV